MSFFKKWFGGGAAKDDKPAKTVEHKGFVIEARPYQDGGQWQTAGVVWKEVEGMRKEHKFIRADRFQTPEEAADFALSKGRQIVDEQGEKAFG